MTTNELLDSLLVDFNFIKTEAGSGLANTTHQPSKDELTGISSRATDSLAAINLFQNPPSPTNFDITKWEAFNGRLEVVPPLARVTWLSGTYYTLQSKSNTLPTGVVGKKYTATARVRAATDSSLSKNISIKIRERTVPGTTPPAPVTVIPSILAGAIAGSEDSVPPYTVTPTLPSHQIDDILVVSCGHENATNFSCSTSGWAPLGTPLNSSNSSSAWFWKRATSSTEDNPVITSSAAGSTSLGIYATPYRIRGCIKTGNPFESVTMNGPANTTAVTSATITTAGPNRLVVSIGVMDNDNIGTHTGYPPALWSAVALQLSLVAGDHGHVCVARGMPTAGAVAAVTLTDQGAINYWRTLTLAFIPAVAVASETTEGPGGHDQGTVIGEAVSPNVALGSIQDFMTITTTYTAQQQASHVDVRITQEGAGAGNAFDVDSVTILVEDPPGPEPEPVPTPGPVVVPNYDTYNAGAFTHADGFRVARNGDNTSETYFSLVSKDNVVPDSVALRTYTGNARVKAGAAGAGKSMYLVLRERNQALTEVARTEKPFLVTSSFQDVTVSHLVSAGGNNMDLYLVMRGAAAGDEFIIATAPTYSFADNSIPAPPPPVPGGETANVRPFDPGHPIYQPIPANCPLASYSAACVNYINSSHRGFAMHSGGDMPPIYIGKVTDPIWRLSIEGRTFNVHAPTGIRSGGGGDNPLIILDESSPDYGGLPVEYRMWRAGINSTSRTVSSSGGGVGVYANNGVRHSFGRGGRALGQAEIHGQNTGSGCSYTVGMIRPIDLTRGVIDHAIRVSVGYPANSGPVWPATKTETWGGGTPPYVPMGSRVFLPNTGNWNTLGQQACASQGISNALNIKLASLFFRAVMEYGWCLLDGTGGGQGVYMENSQTANWPAAAGPFNSVGSYNSIGRGIGAVFPYSQLRIAAPSVFNGFGR